MEPKEKYDLIEQYLAGELKGAALADFEQQLNVDPSLQKEIELHAKVAATLKGEKVHELRSVITSVDQNWQAPQARRIPMRWVMGIAASLALLITAIFLFRPQQDPFVAYFEVYPTTFLTRYDTTNQMILAATQAYNDGSYKDAITQLENLIQTNSNDLRYPFYLGLSHLASEAPDKAIPYLTQVAEEPGNLLQEQARWYQALAYLRVGKSEQAKFILELIEADDFKGKEAKELLRKL